MNYKDIVKKMIEYLNTQDISIICNKTSIPEKTVINTAIIELLSWLKLEKKRENWIEEGRKTKLKPLELNYKYEWCIFLKKLIIEESEFNELFEIKENLLYFKESVPATLQSQIRAEAYALYNPPRFE